MQSSAEALYKIMWNLGGICNLGEIAANKLLTLSTSSAASTLAPRYCWKNVTTLVTNDLKSFRMSRVPSGTATRFFTYEEFRSPCWGYYKHAIQNQPG